MTIASSRRNLLRESCRHLPLFCAAAVVTTVSGCATWNLVGETEPAPREFAAATAEPVPRLDPSLETLVFTIAKGDPARTELAAITESLRVGPVSVSSRKRWAQNGVRVGIADDPTVWASMKKWSLPEDDLNESLLAEADIAHDAKVGETTIPMRPGHQQRFPIRHPIEGDHLLMCRVDDQLIAENLTDAQYLWRIESSPPTSDGVVAIRLTPEAEHGQTRAKFVSSQAAIRIDARRERWTADELTIDWSAQPGQLLVMVADPSAVGLGRTMMSDEKSDGTASQIVVAMRLKNP